MRSYNVDPLDNTEVKQIKTKLSLWFQVSVMEEQWLQGWRLLHHPFVSMWNLGRPGHPSWKFPKSETLDNTRLVCLAVHQPNTSIMPACFLDSGLGVALHLCNICISRDWHLAFLNAQGQLELRLRKTACWAQRCQYGLILLVLFPLQEHFRSLANVCFPENDILFSATYS